jgi:deoxycytidylate deaminase
MAHVAQLYRHPTHQRTHTGAILIQENQKILELGQNSLPQGFKTITETGNSAISQISKVAEKAKDLSSKFPSIVIKND